MRRDPWLTGGELGRQAIRSCAEDYEVCEQHNPFWHTNMQLKRYDVGACVYKHMNT
jgi:hypothetical protein